MKIFINNLKDSVIIILLIFCTELILKIVVQNINWKFFDILKDNLTIDQEIFSQFLICGIGVAGVFLALYYSNIATIYSSEYANTISKIRKLFEYEISQNINLNKINTYIIESILILLTMMIGFPIWYIFIIYMIIKSINIIISFIINGNTIYEFSNIYNTLLNRKKELVFYMDSVTEKGYLNTDLNFQNFYGEQAVRILEDMSTVNNYVIETNDLNKKDTILEFIKNNTYILQYYLCIKNQITYKSLWFQRKMQHKKWYSADFSEKGIALNTGTELQPKDIIDIDWFEINILKMNEKAIMFFIKNGCIKEITYYMKAISDSIPYWIKFGNINLWYEHINKIIMNIKNTINNKLDKKDISNLFEIICYLCIHYVLSVREFIEKIDLKECNKFFKNDYRFTEKELQETNNRVFNNDEFYNIYKALKNEKNIEKKIITPIWYLKQRVSKLYINEINNLLKVVEKLYVMNFNLGMELLKNKEYTYSASFIINENEMYNKVNLIPETCNIIFDNLLSNNIERDYSLPAIYIKEMIKNIQNIHFEKVPELWEKSCEIWGLKDKNNERDVFGFCYNNLCEYIFQNILNFNYETFAIHYESLVRISILSEIDIHEELIENREYSDNTKFKFQMSGLNVMFELSGYAIIVGEILNDYRWKKKIDDTINKICEKTEDKEINDVKRWSIIINCLVNDIRNIGGIDISNRKLRFSNIIEKTQKLKFEHIGSFDNKRAINTKNLEKMYYSEMTGLSVDMREIFAIACLNKHLDVKDKYKSNKIKIEEWVDMNDE